MSFVSRDHNIMVIVATSIAITLFLFCLLVAALFIVTAIIIIVVATVIVVHSIKIRKKMVSPKSADCSNNMIRYPA